MSPGKGRGRTFLFVIPLVFWELLRPLPRPVPLLKVGSRTYGSGEEILIMEGLPYTVKVELLGGVRALGEEPVLFKGRGTIRDFMDESGFGLRGPWGKGGCFVERRDVKWRGPFTPYPNDGGGYVLMVPWFTRVPLEVEVDKEWLCDVRTPSGTRIERVKEKGVGRFSLKVLEAREAWYRTLYVTAWGVEDGKLRAILDHMVFLMNLLEDQVGKGEEGMVRLNLLAWKDTLDDLKEHLGVMASRGEPVGVWVRLLPSWRAWPQIEKREKEATAMERCWEWGAKLLGIRVQGPMAVFPFSLFSRREKGGKEESSPGVWALFPLVQTCWARWREEVDVLVPGRSSAVEADREIKGELNGGGTWQVGWVPWR